MFIWQLHLAAGQPNSERSLACTRWLSQYCSCFRIQIPRAPPAFRADGVYGIARVAGILCFGRPEQGAGKEARVKNSCVACSARALWAWINKPRSRCVQLCDKTHVVHENCEDYSRQVTPEFHLVHCTWHIAPGDQAWLPCRMVQIIIIRKLVLLDITSHETLCVY